MIEIKVLGTGCARCNELEMLCKNTVAENSIVAEIQKITDIKEIMSYGILQTPGLVINGEVKLTGKLPAKATLLQWMLDARKQNL